MLHSFQVAAANEALTEKAVKELKHNKTCVVKINVFPKSSAEESLISSNKGAWQKKSMLHCIFHESLDIFSPFGDFSKELNNRKY